MAADGRETGELIVHRDQVLEGAEGDCSHREAAAQVEGAHVGLDQCDAGLDLRRLGAEAVPADVEHAGRSVDAGDFQAGARAGDEDAARAAAEFENPAADAPRLIHVEGHVGAVRVRHDVVVQVGGDSVVVSARGKH